MALNKVTYTDDVTVIEAQNLNNIQDEIIGNIGRYARITGTFTGTDLNSLTDSGFWYCSNASANTPHSTTYYWVLVISGGGSITRQVAFHCNDNFIWSRERNSSGTWKSWELLITNKGTADNTIKGNVYIENPNSGTAQGWTILTLGNNIPVGTTQNTAGVLRLRKGQYRIDIFPSGTPTADRDIGVPNASGTLALEAFTSGATYPAGDGSNTVNYYHGWVTGSNKQITFNVELPKRYTGQASGISYTFTEIIARGTQGYINYGSATGSQNLYNQFNDCAITKRSDYVFTVALNFTNALSNVTNNTPVGLYIIGKFTFT